MKRSLAIALFLVFFAVVDASTTVADSRNLEMRLSAENTSVRVGERLAVRIQITNHKDEIVTLVQPGDGSDSGWRTPVVGWSIIQGAAQHATEPTYSVIFRMCGNINPLQPNEVFTLAPGETKQIEAWFHLPAFQNVGVYKVVALYANRPLMEWRGIPLGEHGREAMQRVRNSTATTLSSNEVVFTVSE